MESWQNKYKIIKELEGGASSKCFLVQDSKGNNLVIKTPSMDNYDQWEKECQNEISIASSLAEHTNRKYDIPISTLQGEDGNKYMVSSLIKGEGLNKSKLNQLSSDEQNQIAESLAQFMYHLHSQSIRHNENREYESNSSEFFHNNDYENLKREIYKHLSSQAQDSMNNVFESFDKDSNIGKTKSTCHNDLIKDNLFYDSNNKKLGIIDFGDASENDIYADFANLMKMGQLGDQFAIKVINQYNNLHRKNGSNIRINAHSAKKYAIMKSFKSLKKLDKINDIDRKIQVLKFNNYMEEYNENKSSGLFKVSCFRSKSSEYTL